MKQISVQIIVNCTAADLPALLAALEDRPVTVAGKVTPVAMLDEELFSIDDPLLPDVLEYTLAHGERDAVEIHTDFRISLLHATHLYNDIKKRTGFDPFEVATWLDSLKRNKEE